MLGIPPSLLTIAIVQILWALPFATLVVLTAMSTFDPVYLEAAYVAGADRWRAFLDIELPLIRAGIFGAATFSLILSFNETIRTAVVQGPYNTVQTYIWSTYKQIGLSPALYALMSLLIALTLVLVAAFVLRGARRTPGGQSSSGDDRLRREADVDRGARAQSQASRRGRGDGLPVGEPQRIVEDGAAIDGASRRACRRIGRDCSASPSRIAESGRFPAAYAPVGARRWRDGRTLDHRAGEPVGGSRSRLPERLGREHIAAAEEVGDETRPRPFVQAFRRVALDAPPRFTTAMRLAHRQRFLLVVGDVEESGAGPFGGRLQVRPAWARRIFSSSAESGSSSSSMRGEGASARASATRCCSPPLSMRHVLVG